MALSQAQAVSWADGYLKYIGAPATGTDDPRVKFLAAQVIHEGTAAKNNPLAIEAGGKDGLPGNTARSANTENLRTDTRPSRVHELQLTGVSNRSTDLEHGHCESHHRTPRGDLGGLG